MLSTTFLAELHPDPRLRRIVLGSGLLLCVAGIPVIGTLGIGTPGKAALVVTWLAVFARQWLSIRSAYARNGILRVDAGGRVRCRRAAGVWEALEILPGSVVTTRWAWLRLGRAGTRGYAELLRGDARQSEDWRRFQVIWRHIGAAS